jgi:hypothetical protein
VNLVDLVGKEIDVDTSRNERLTPSDERRKWIWLVTVEGDERHAKLQTIVVPHGQCYGRG